MFRDSLNPSEVVQEWDDLIVQACEGQRIVINDWNDDVVALVSISDLHAVLALKELMAQIKDYMDPKDF